MPRRRPAELHVNHERWLVSYADFITLLFAFFVVMYSISQVSESKYRVLSDTLVEAFNPSRSISPIQVGQPSVSPSTSAIDIRGDDRGDTEFDNLGDLTELSEAFQERFGDLIGEDLLQIYSNEFWLQIELKDSILFASGGAEPSARARAIFDDIAGILRDYTNPVQVEGFTDNVPIRTERYPSNWELSAARASAIVKSLAANGVSPERLSAVGYGEYQPVASNDTAEGRAQNRRVALMISREKIERPGTPAERIQHQRGMEAPSLQDSAPGERELRGPPEPIEPDAVAADAPSQAVVPEEVQQEEVQPAEAEQGGIQPIELEGGGLLFSSDPELPRSR